MKSKILIFLFVLGFVFLAVPMVFAQVSTDQLEAYYKLDETSGTTAEDAHNDNDGTASNSRVFDSAIAGIINTGADFTQGSDDIEITSSGSFPPSGANAFSYSVWINASATGSSMNIFAWGNDSANNFNGFRVNPAGTVRHYFFSNDLDTTQTVTAGDWIHLVVTYDGSSNRTIYWDGQLEATDNPGAVNVAQTNAFIGSDKNDAAFFDGIIDEVGIWQRVLTPQEVNDLYNNGNALSYDSFVGDVAVTLSSPANNTEFTEDTFNFVTDIDNFNNLTIINATTNVWYSNGSLFDSGNEIINDNSSDIQTNITISNIELGDYEWNTDVFYENDTGGIESISGDSNLTFSRESIQGNSTFSASTVETKRETFEQIIEIPSGSIISDSTLWWNGTDKGGSSSLISGNNYTLSSAFDIPLGTGTVDFYWNVTLDSSFEQKLETNQQSISLANFSLCGGSNNVEYLNFTFKEETTAQNDTNASIPRSEFVYFLGSGDVNKTFSFTEASELSSYELCFSPSDETINSTVSLDFINSESEQRTYSPGLQSLNNETTSTTLWLLPTTEGIFVTFQVVDAGESPVQGAIITLERSGFGEITQTTTGASGSASIFLNPSATYTLTVEKEGFDTFSATQTFPDSSFTVSLGGEQEDIPDDFTQGVGYTIQPRDSTLFNGTTYNFNFTVSSDFWSINEFGFTLTNSSGDVIGSASAGTNGGIVSTNLNVGNNTEIHLNGYWTIDGNTTNVTRSWIVLDSGLTGYSIFQWVKDLKAYLSVGMFGLDNFGLRIIIFSIILITVGTLSFKFGITSPGALMALLVALVAFFDVALGLVPNPVDAVPFFPTILVALVAMGTIIAGGRL